MASLSMRAYARHRSVTIAAVQRAIESGRISRQPDGRIDPEVADHQWQKNTRWTPRITLNAPQAGGNQFGPSGSQYLVARTVRERYAALLAKHEYEERAAKLIERDKVKAEAQKALREFRGCMLSTTDCVAGLVAQENNPEKVHEILDAAIRTALNEFAGPPVGSPR